ncbi:Invasion protein IalB, involved in pathogenesis [Bradyrhizobium lablabi]|uniref:Invasion protein IalB, involved in pathogenesis n=1 Tax=Bradyrhizobium lablabi TaxID=722472 RepID=A0A1M6XS10_9BRAD|nr:invasion associated locus B family protein [Bradyrhizobium lablabi]SHL08734.1 Invasion protein IalB, involved in pathogenesis [Bradyrhizobium lablabi]
MVPPVRFFCTAALVLGVVAMTRVCVAQTSESPGKQTTPPAAQSTQATTDQKPQLTTATYDDWTVSCRTAQASNETNCDMTQVQTIKGQKNPVGQVTFARTAKDGPILLVVQIPPTLWIESGVKFAFDEKDPGFPVTVKWCAPSRCFAQSELSKDQIAKLKARADPATIEYKEASQHEVSLPVSFKGFGPAFEAIQKK